MILIRLKSFLIVYIDLFQQIYLAALSVTHFFFCCWL